MTGARAFATTKGPEGLIAMSLALVDQRRYRAYTLLGYAMVDSPTFADSAARWRQARYWACTQPDVVIDKVLEVEATEWEAT